MKLAYSCVYIALFLNMHEFFICIHCIIIFLIPAWHSSTVKAKHRQ